MRYVGPALLIIIVVALSVGWFARSNISQAVTSSVAGEVSLADGEALYQQSCAACHGVDLEGQDNWRSPGPDGRLPAPPHDQTGHTWHHSDEVLFNYTKLGGTALMAQQGVEFNSGMPGFGDQLTDDQIWSILNYIKSTWPENVRESQEQRN